MCLIGEILLVRRVEPVIGHADMETTGFISQGKVKLLSILWLRDTYTSPSCQRQALVTNTECWLQRDFSQILTTPDILVYNICSDCCFHLILRRSSRSKSNQTKCKGTHFLYIKNLLHILLFLCDTFLFLKVSAAKVLQIEDNTK